MLSGATGQFYGNHYTWQFADGWKDHLDTPGSAQIGYLAKLFAGRRWFRLVPDQAHKIVTAGYGTFATTGNVGSSNYVTTASTPDGTLAMSYLPTGGTIAVNMARFAGAGAGTMVRPYERNIFQASRAPRSQAPAAPSLTTPGKNADGDPTGCWC